MPLTFCPIWKEFAAYAHDFRIECVMFERIAINSVPKTVPAALHSIWAAYTIWNWLKCHIVQLERTECSKLMCFCQDISINSLWKWNKRCKKHTQNLQCSSMNPKFNLLPVSLKNNCVLMSVGRFVWIDIENGVALSKTIVNLDKRLLERVKKKEKEGAKGQFWQFLLPSHATKGFEFICINQVKRWFYYCLNYENDNKLHIDVQHKLKHWTQFWNIKWQQFFSQNVFDNDSFCRRIRDTSAYCTAHMNGPEWK